MKRPGAMLALLLALLWAPAASHCLLEHAGWIHHSHACADHDASTTHEQHEEDSHGHDAADGNCQLPATVVKGAKRVTAPSDFAWLPAVLEPPAAASRPDPRGASDTGSFSLHFSPRWRFALRTALSPRAPSC